MEYQHHIDLDKILFTNNTPNDSVGKSGIFCSGMTYNTTRSALSCARRRYTMGASYPLPESVCRTIERSLGKSTLSYCEEPMPGIPWALDGLQSWGTSLAGLIEKSARPWGWMKRMH